EAMWTKAQTTLKDNFLFSRRSARNHYLLRAKVKCGLCGLTYIGSNACRPNGKREFYYICNGKHGARGLYGAQGKRCPAKSVNGVYLENLIWQEIEAFLRDPGSVMEELKRRIALPKQTGTTQSHAQMDLAVKNKGNERTRVLALYRRGIIDDATLDAQLREIDAEESEIRKLLSDAEQQIQVARSGALELSATENLLDHLRERLSQGLSWEIKR